MADDRCFGEKALLYFSLFFGILGEEIVDEGSVIVDMGADKLTMSIDVRIIVDIIDVLVVQIALLGCSLETIPWCYLSSD